MVQDVCFFLGKLAFRSRAIGTTTLTIHGRPTINEDVEFYPSEDPIEAMRPAGRGGRHRVRHHHPPGAHRVHWRFELALLEGMGMKYLITPSTAPPTG